MAIQDQIPRSRITLTYRTTISGEPETVELPLRLLVLADLKRVKERAADDEFELRRVRGITKDGLSAVMEDLKLGTNVTVPGLFSSEETASLKFKSMRDFDPDRVAEQVGSINALREMRTLLMEMRSKIANQRDFRKSLNNVFTPSAWDSVITELNENQFGAFQIVAPTLAGDDDKPADNRPADPAKPPDKKEK